MRLLLPLTVLMLGLMIHQTAVARPFYVEGPALRTRSEAATIAQVVQQAGYRARVVRRYGHGDGWRFAVVLDGFDARAQATEAARRVSDLTGRSHGVFTAENQVPVQIEASPVGERGAGAAQTTGAILARARSAHGGPGVFDKVRDADQVVFRFMRKTADGRTVLHTYARRAGERYLRIDVVEGAGTSSELRASEDGAWLRVGDRGWQPQDGPRTMDVMEGFAPHQVLEAALVLPDALIQRRELALLQVASTEEDRTQLRYDGTGRPVSVWVDHGTGRVVRLVLGDDGDQVSRDLIGDAGSLLAPVPERMVTRGGGRMLDDVQVLLLEADGVVPDAWFVAPGT